MMILSRFFVAIALIVTLLSPLMPGLQSASAAPDDPPSPPASADGPNALPDESGRNPICRFAVCRHRDGGAESAAHPQPLQRHHQ